MTRDQWTPPPVASQASRNSEDVELKRTEITKDGFPGTSIPQVVGKSNFQQNRDRIKDKGGIMKDPRGSESQAQRGLLVSLNAYCVPSLATGVENYSNHWGCLKTVKEDTRERKQFRS